MAYDPSYFQQEGETLAEFMQRLAKTRAAGVLGGGGMFYEKPSETTPAETIAIDPVTQEVTSAPLGQATYGSSYEADSKAGWDRMKTLEQKTAEALARQSELYAPKGGAAFGLVAGSGLLGAAADKLGEWLDAGTAKDYLDKVGFTEQYGEEAADAMSKNELAMMHLMSQGEMTPVGGFERFDMSKYKPATWGDVLGNAGKGLINSVFGTDYELWSQPAMSAPYMAATDPAIRSTQGMFDSINGQQINTLEDIFNQSTVGNMFAGYGNWNPIANGYTIGTAANRNPTGGYTIGTAANRKPTGGYLIGRSSGESPIAATNTVQVPVATSYGVDVINVPSAGNSYSNANSLSEAASSVQQQMDTSWGSDYSYW